MAVSPGPLHWRIVEGDALERLRDLEAESVQTVVTSPPYWGLRDYGTASWEGGDEECDHLQPVSYKSSTLGASSGGRSEETHQRNIEAQATPYRNCCGKCGATRTDSQLGLEPTPEEYVANLVAVFREVRRVLRDDGTVWLNLGDSYAGQNSGHGKSARVEQGSGQGKFRVPSQEAIDARWSRTATVPPGLKPKDLVGIPWRVARALQEPYYTGQIKDERDRVWLAAMIDAEGCMFIHRRKAGQSNGQGYKRKSDSFGAGLEVSSTDRSIVERCLAITGLGSICEQSPEQNKRRKQTIYRWNLRSNVCRDVVREVYPYFTAKHHEARLLCGCPSSGEKARAAWEALKAIHQGGEHPDIDFPAPGSMYESGWFLRSDVIWSKKPNPMPESVTDRPTRSHEYIFLLTKSARYFYDADAVREENARLWDESNIGAKNGWATGEKTGKVLGRDSDPHGGLVEALPNPAGRNKRSVWTVSTQPYAEAHFATFPPKLIEPCVLAGTPTRCCGECGAPWERVTSDGGLDSMAVSERPQQRRAAELAREHGLSEEHLAAARATGPADVGRARATQNGVNAAQTALLAAEAKDALAGYFREFTAPIQVTTGWRSTCSHNDDAGRSTVLDPFAGSGTTGLVALRHDRSFIGIELSPAYCEMARNRIRDDAPLFNYQLEHAD